MPLDFELREPPLLSRMAPDRLAELRERPDELAAGWRTAVVLRVDRRGRFATDPSPEGRKLSLQPAFDLAERPPHHATFLGACTEGRHLWSIGVDELPDEPGIGDLRTLGSDLAPGDAALAAEAVAVDNWHRAVIRGREPWHHPRLVQAGWAGIDPFHGGTEFPRTDPAVICLVHDGGSQVLLARGRHWPEGRRSVLAGFVEAGESLENCVGREIREEVGLTVQRIRYLGSQPWPFPRSLMVGFHAVADPGDPLVLADGEIVEAEWYGVDEVDAALRGRHAGLVLPPEVSIAHGMIDSWVAAVQRERRERADADTDPDAAEDAARHPDVRPR